MCDDIRTYQTLNEKSGDTNSRIGSTQEHQSASEEESLELTHINHIKKEYRNLIQGDSRYK